MYVCGFKHLLNNSLKIFDTEKCIILIESNPCLWDIASKDYMDKNVKNTCWRNVAESMYIGNWCELSETQKDEYANYYFNISFLYI